MASNLSPCKGCEERQVGCHGQCEKYAEYKAERWRMWLKRKDEHQVSTSGFEYAIKVNKHRHKSGVG